MDEYIERESIYKILYDLAELFKEAKVADVAPVVHAHWEDKGWAGMICSNCGENAIEGHYDYQVLSKYCPYCGAKMDKKED